MDIRPCLKSFFLDKLNHQKHHDIDSQDYNFIICNELIDIEFIIKITFSSHLTKSNIEIEDRAYFPHDGFLEIILEKQKKFNSNKKYFYPGTKENWLFLYDRQKRNYFNNESLNELNKIIENNIKESFNFTKICLDYANTEEQSKRYIFEFKKNLPFETYPIFLLCPPLIPSTHKYANALLHWL